MAELYKYLQVALEQYKEYFLFAVKEGYRGMMDPDFKELVLAVYDDKFDKYVEICWKRFDKNGDGKLSFEEFFSGLEYLMHVIKIDVKN